MHLPEPCMETGTSGNALQKASRAKHHRREQRIKWAPPHRNYSQCRNPPFLEQEGWSWVITEVPSSNHSVSFCF